jgi:hypothetical protein
MHESILVPFVYSAGVLLLSRGQIGEKMQQGSIDEYSSKTGLLPKMLF